MSLFKIKLQTSFQAIEIEADISSYSFKILVIHTAEPTFPNSYSCTTTE